MKERLCTPNIELLAVGMRPYYLPREFTSTIVIAVFRSGDREEQRGVQCELREALRTWKDNYRRKLENKLLQNRVRDVWTGINHITGMKGKIRQTSGSLDRANQFKQFFNRFS